MRNSGKYELDFFFNYYLSKGGMVTDPGEFTENFVYIHMVQPTPPGFPEMKIRTGEIDRQAVLNHMDTVFDLTILVDKEGQFKKVVE
jgi:hypothetical protein